MLFPYLVGALLLCTPFKQKLACSPVTVVLAEQPGLEGGLHFGRGLRDAALEHFNGRFAHTVVEGML